MRKTAVLIALFALTAAFTVSPGESRAQVRTAPPDLTIDAATRTEVIETAIKRLNERYVFPDVAKKMEQALRERLARKEYDAVTSARQFSEMLTAHLQEVSRDKHIRVGYSLEAVPEDQEGGEPSADELERYRQYGRRTNFGFERIERLPGNIGYVDLRGFFEANEDSAQTVASAMNFLNNTEAIIFDLRKNGGGSPQMVALISSYLFSAEKPVHLNSLYWRKGDRTEEFWTLKEVGGKRYGNKDVYVLTSNRTFSAAEEFTYNLKNLKRATIIGETTGGGANPGGGARLARNFRMFVPTGRAINPITKTNWEGTGVKPDVEVPADQALKTAHVAALRKIVDKTTDAQFKGALQEQIENLQKELNGTKEKK